MTLRHLTVLCSLVILLTGCGFFSRTKNQYYTLEVLPPPAEAAPPLSGSPFAIGAIQLPPGLDRREMAVKDARHQLDIRGNHLWSDSLETMVLHTLAHDLAARLPEGMIVLPGQPQPAGPIRAIDVIFEDLTPGPQSALVLNARWTLRGSATRQVRIEVPMQSLDSADVASAMSQALATLSERIVAQLTG